MKTQTTMIALLLATLGLAAIPTVSAHHGYHECTPQDPCDNQGNQGCSGAAGVSCPYEGHGNCYYFIRDDMTQGRACYHYTRQCLVSVLDRCYLEDPDLSSYFRYLVF